MRLFSIHTYIQHIRCNGSPPKQNTNSTITVWQSISLLSLFKNRLCKSIKSRSTRSSSSEVSLLKKKHARVSQRSSQSAKDNRRATSPAPELSYKLKRETRNRSKKTPCCCLFLSYSTAAHISIYAENKEAKRASE